MQSMRRTHSSRLVSGFAAALVVSMAAFSPRALAQGYPADGPAPQAPAPAPQAPVPVDPNAPQTIIVVDGADGADPDSYADTDPSALTDFREPLAPYGQWTEDPNYGTIWVPDANQVGADFAPYQTGGSWGVADGGDWMWQSDYSWGYIPFHYGRWVWAGSNWGWIPGRRYAPAWVSWRVGEGGYLGWAPLPPTWYWAGGSALGLRSSPYAAYCFVPTNYAFHRSVSSYVVRDRGMVQSIAAGTRPYHAATPTVGGHGYYNRRSPTLSEAHIPSSASPRTRATADARSMAYATHSATAATAAAHRGGYAGYSGESAQAVHTYRAGSGSVTSVTSGSGVRSGYEHASRAQSPGLRTPGYERGAAASRGYGASYPSYSASPHHASSQPGTFHAAPRPPRPVDRGERFTARSAVRGGGAPPLTVTIRSRSRSRWSSVSRLKEQCDAPLVLP